MKNNHDPKILHVWLPWRAQFWETQREDAELQLERSINWRQKIGEEIIELLEYLDILPQILTREYVAADQIFAEDLERDPTLIYLVPKREQIAKLRVRWLELNEDVEKLEFAFAFENFNTIGSIFAPPRPKTEPTD
jgi:hypothetical protein